MTCERSGRCFSASQRVQNELRHSNGFLSVHVVIIYRSVGGISEINGHLTNVLVGSVWKSKLKIVGQHPLDPRIRHVAPPFS